MKNQDFPANVPYQRDGETIFVYENQDQPGVWKYGEGEILAKASKNDTTEKSKDGDEKRDEMETRP